MMPRWWNPELEWAGLLEPMTDEERTAALEWRAERERSVQAVAELVRRMLDAPGPVETSNATEDGLMFTVKFPGADGEYLIHVERNDL